MWGRRPGRRRQQRMGALPQWLQTRQATQPWPQLARGFAQRLT